MEFMTALCFILYQLKSNFVFPCIEPSYVTKVITWKRSHSSSSRNPLTKDDNDESGSDFLEEVCMIAGSHSSTLDRLYAWERKLYDEVKVDSYIPFLSYTSFILEDKNG